MLGDVGKAVEPSIASLISPAKIRVVKVAHHGSLTSSGEPFVAAARPAVAVASVGRSNAFGHPSPLVVKRYESAGAEVLRTDRDGAVTIDTDGRSVSVSTYSAARFTCCQRASSSSSVASWR